ncbi:hypothetical protein B0H15DRAFT_958788 [Mycena belliarum]|uniref:Uncharacterized protein n=1 Tax=Mycena belliarum TaxID=1033014 RepID=A0AAD6XK91_9AGAR|nr:hypothetical protein B0H15DRAFT_958788 [Mycena belliae]
MAELSGSQSPSPQRSREPTVALSIAPLFLSPGRGRQYQWLSSEAVGAFSDGEGVESWHGKGVGRLRTEDAAWSKNEANTEDDSSSKDDIDSLDLESMLDPSRTLLPPSNPPVVSWPSMQHGEPLHASFSSQTLPPSVIATVQAYSWEDEGYGTDSDSDGVPALISSDAVGYVQPRIGFAPLPMYSDVVRQQRAPPSEDDDNDEPDCDKQHPLCRPLYQKNPPGGATSPCCRCYCNCSCCFYLDAAAIEGAWA